MVARLDGKVLEPDPLLRLERVQGYTGEFVRTLTWVPHGEEVVFASASTVVAMRGACRLQHVGHDSGSSSRSGGGPVALDLVRAGACSPACCCNSPRGGQIGQELLNSSHLMGA